jgi:hypothetical protein
MTTTLRIILAATVAAAFVACTGGDRVGLPECPPTAGDPAALPTWKLEDIQPESPRVGQTYGLDTFSGKIIVVTLVEGY